MEVDVLGLAKRLMGARTVTGDGDAISKALDHIKSLFPDDVVKKEFERNGVKSLLVSFAENPKLLLHGHIDVVPGPDDMFEPRVEDGFLRGRGALDMLGGLASLICVMQKLCEECGVTGRRPDVGILITSDEEVGGRDGAGLVATMLKPEFVISGEYTDLGIGNQAKGVLTLELSVKGRAAHAAQPWEGENAIVKFSGLVPKVLALFPEEGDYFSTVTFSRVSAGDVDNRVPGLCTAVVNIRYVPDDSPEDIVRKIGALGVETRVKAMGAASFCPEDNKYVSLIKDVLKERGVEPRVFPKHGASDVRHFQKNGVQGVVFGPSGKGMHGMDERVEIASLEKYFECVLELCRRV